ncbi:helix-turn-helix domain-containing protein [Arthrobacter sp. SD76]|uniref:helix-turn-helix domain-containing protein n=1 Tax=Arthrobacter sp. SD76 TaxID=3415007 RepID=UPI003C77F22F
MPTPTKGTRRGPRKAHPYNDDWGRVGATLRELRLAKGATQDELATAVGFVRGSSIAQIEAGLKPLTDQKLLLVADYLGIRPLAIRRPELLEKAAS